MCMIVNMYIYFEYVTFMNEINKNVTFVAVFFAQIHFETVGLHRVSLARF